jgi:hypothetical protein
MPSSFSIFLAAKLKNCLVIAKLFSKANAFAPYAFKT